MNVDAKLLHEVEAIAHRAGHAIMRVYAREFSVQVKADQSPLTEADWSAHAIIIEALEALTPSVPILSEEAVETFPRSFSGERYWLVDPLDGTKEFIKRNGEFTVNIALIEGGGRCSVWCMRRRLRRRIRRSLVLARSGSGRRTRLKRSMSRSTGQGLPGGWLEAGRTRAIRWRRLCSGLARIP